MKVINYIFISSLILAFIIAAVVFIAMQTKDININEILDKSNSYKSISGRQTSSEYNKDNPEKTINSNTGDNGQESKNLGIFQSGLGGGGGGGGGSGGSSQGSSSSAITENIINEEYAYLGTPVYCSEESRNIESCENASQHPICGWFDVASNKCTNSLCVQSFSNECTACKDSSIIYWIDGDCPLHT